MPPLVRHPNAARPGPGFLRHLHDSEWTVANGTRVAVPDMTTTHLWNVLGYLRWYAPQVAEQIPDRDGLGILESVTSTPIWASICTELIERGEIGRREDALAHLRAGGETAWERKERYAIAAKARRAAKASVKPAAKTRATTP
jgi:hypothetical protein